MHACIACRSLFVQVSSGLFGKGWTSKSKRLRRDNALLWKRGKGDGPQTATPGALHGGAGTCVNTSPDGASDSKRERRRLPPTPADPWVGGEEREPRTGGREQRWKSSADSKERRECGARPERGLESSTRASTTDLGGPKISCWRVATGSGEGGANTERC